MIYVLTEVLSLCMPDQTDKEGYEHAGKWKAIQKRWKGESPGWKSPCTANVKPPFAGFTGIFVT